MEISVSPTVLAEIQNVEKDDSNRKSAVKTLNFHLEGLDPKGMTLFLDRCSEALENGSSSGDCTISVYEVLARSHGPKIVPHIDNIMTTIIKTLESSSVSSANYEACVKVVLAIARYGIEPSTPEDKKKHVIHSLCKPLSDSLLVSKEDLSSGAAYCLKALVELGDWRFASHQMVNEVCQRVVGALEKQVEITFHVGLVVALARHNSLIVEAYARLLIRSGLQILNSDADNKNLQRQLLAIKMINFLMKSLDPRSTSSEIGLIVEEMEKCQSDMLANVQMAAFEALQTARRIISVQGSKMEDDMSSATGSNCCSRENNNQSRRLWSAGGKLCRIATPESQTANSYAHYDSQNEAPISVYQGVNSEFWSHNDDAVSVEDSACLFQGSSGNGMLYSPNHQGSCYDINVGSDRIFTTPRMLTGHVQGPNEVQSEHFGKRCGRYGSPYTSNLGRSPKQNCDQYDLLHDVNLEITKNENLFSRPEQHYDTLEPTSSTEDAYFDPDLMIVDEKVASRSKSKAKIKSKERKSKKKPRKFVVNLVCLIFVVLIAFLTTMFWNDEYDKGYTTVPT